MIFTKCKKTKLPLLAINSVLALAIFVHPADAATLPIFRKVQDLFSTFKSYVQQFKSEFALEYGELSQSVESAINSALGVDGIPDPLKAGQKIEAVISQQTVQTIATNPGLQGQDAKIAWNQQYSKALSESTLGVEGQKITKQETDDSVAATQVSGHEAANAQSELVTQDVLKRIASQNAQQAIISKSIQSSAQATTKHLATANLNLADISGRMNDQQLRQQFEESAEVRQVLQAAAFNDGFWAEPKK